MELFSEIYGVYYQIVADVLAKAPLSREEVGRIAAESGFGESVLQLVPKLLGDGWRLLEEHGGKWHSRLKRPVRVPVSDLELRWLKAVLADPRARLFLSDQEITRLKEKLRGVPCLYEEKWFHFFDRNADGDIYQEKKYVENFRFVMSAMRSGTPVQITYRSGGRGKAVRERTASYLPLKLEYSEKDDKFRVYCAKVCHSRPVQYVLLNLGRIVQVEDTMEQCGEAGGLEEWLAQTRCAQPVVVRVSRERNAIERFLVEFSSYEKRSEFDEENGVCRVSIWYPRQDETEVLIRILGFGPAVQVLSPPLFLKQVKRRVACQVTRLNRQLQAGCAAGSALSER